MLHNYVKNVCYAKLIFQILCINPCPFLYAQNELLNTSNYTNDISIHNHSINVSRIYSYKRLKKITADIAIYTAF